MRIETPARRAREVAAVDLHAAALRRSRVIGAGPAGLAAATLAARARPRHRADRRAARNRAARSIARSARHRCAIARCSARTTGTATTLVARSAPSARRTCRGATVWSVRARRRRTRVAGARLSRSTATRGCARARRSSLATGAQERPFPIPGWTLPGVMSAGAAQILLKSSGAGPERTHGARGLRAAAVSARVAVAQRRRADRGAPRHDAARPAGARAAACAGFVRSPYFAKGLRSFARSAGAVRIMRRCRFACSRRRRSRRARPLSRRTARRRARGAICCCCTRASCRTSISRTRSAATHAWDERAHCCEPRVDAWGASSVPGVWIAGDGGGIAGARRGGAQRADRGARRRATRLARDRRRTSAMRWPRRIARARARTRGRAFFDVLFRPPHAFRVPREHNRLPLRGSYRAADPRRGRAGCPGPNQLKAFLRCGMGPCQGRMCGLTVIDLIADARGVHPRTSATIGCASRSSR